MKREVSLMKHTFNIMTEQTYYYTWRNNAKRATLYHRRCKIIARGKMNSLLVKFSNDQREIISGNALRKQIKPKRIETPCATCGTITYPLWRKQCNTCSQYELRTSKKRPEYLWNRAIRSRCKNPRCKIPLQGIKPKARTGMCNACYDYHRKHHRHRPAELCQQPPGGWCDCGNPAIHVHKIVIIVGTQRQRQETLNLCQPCFQEVTT